VPALCVRQRHARKHNNMSRPKSVMRLPSSPKSSSRDYGEVRPQEESWCVDEVMRREMCGPQRSDSSA